MLLSVTFTFLILTTPWHLHEAYRAFSGTVNWSEEEIVIYILTSLLYFSNSAVNFYLYCFFGRKFRRVFIKIFCRCSFLLKKKILDSDTSIAFRSTVRRRNSRKRNSQTLRSHLPDTHPESDQGMFALKDSPPHYNTLVTELPDANGTIVVSKYTKLCSSPSTQL